MAKKRSNVNEEMPNTDQTGPAQSQAQQPLTTMIMKYFTPEVNKAVADLSVDQMVALLRELEQTSFWIAILKFNNMRQLAAQSVVNSIDPVKDPTAISRAQGNMSGVVDLQNWVIQLIEMERQAKQDAEEIRNLGVEE